MRSIVALLSSCVIGAIPAMAQAPADSTKQPVAWDPTTIVWQHTDTDGTRFSVLEGRRDAAGKVFTYAYFLPAGHWEHHWHSGDARVAVVYGALRVGYGEQLDSTAAVTYPTGTFLFVPAGRPHTMGAAVNTIIIGIAVGPWSTHYEQAGEGHTSHAHPRR
jgi:quercetin dioxygenase-like cupin family protein